MQDTIRIWVPADPKGSPRRTVFMQRRPGATLRDCYAGRCHTLKNKRGKVDRGFRGAVKLGARRVVHTLESKFGKAPIFVVVHFWMQRPKSHYSGSDRSKHLLPSAPEAWECTIKPDSDNVEKSVWDALKGLAWDDDQQVNTNITTKRWAATPRQVGAWVIAGRTTPEALESLGRINLLDPWTY